MHPPLPDHDMPAGDAGILQALINHAGMLVLKLDPAGRILWFNSVFEQLSGIRLEDVRGHDWVEVFVPPDAREDTRHVCRSLAGRARGEVHTKPFLISEKGRVRQVEWFHTDLQDEDSRTAAILCIGRDVTDLQDTRGAPPRSSPRRWASARARWRPTAPTSRRSSASPTARSWCATR